MKYIKRSISFKYIALFLILIFFQSDLRIMAADLIYQNEIKSSVLLFKEGRYIELIKRNEKLFTEIDKEQTSIRGKLFLLTGAAYEMTGNKDKAVENYLLGDLLLAKPEIEGVDLKSLKVFNSTIYGKVVNGKRVFEKVGKRKRKKKFPFLAIAGAAAIVVAVLVLFKKKTKESTEDLSRDYAVEVLSEIEWIEIPAGEFEMGDHLGTGDTDERPSHTVYLDSYKISKYEITYDQFFKFDRVNENVKATFGGRGDGYPVTSVNLSESVEFCRWLSEKTYASIRIPTEAQWEKAARGTDRRTYPWGNQAPDCDRTNFYNCGGQTRIVGLYPEDKSFYGVMDMGGNVSEWVIDGYLEDFYSVSPYSNPIGPDYNKTDYHILRGGNFMESDCRVTNRIPIYHFFGGHNYGFRVVMLN